MVKMVIKPKSSTTGGNYTQVIYYAPA
jgi:hypothetical protein